MGRLVPLGALLGVLLGRFVSLLACLRGLRGLSVSEPSWGRPGACLGPAEQSRSAWGTRRAP
eukprot:7710831-Pyramimonas_sp.AAC.1